MEVKLFEPFGYEIDPDCNGCGSGWNARLIPNTIYRIDIRPACCVHDHMYTTAKNLDGKAEADRVLLNNMLRLIEAKEGWWFPHSLARRRALKYYEVVVNFGGPAFWDGKKQ